MYKPEIAKSLLDIKQNQIRLALIGAPSTGKTWSSLTFPNPIIADFDNKLGAHRGRDIMVLPFYDADFIVKDCKLPKLHPMNPPNRRDAFLFWLQKEAPKLELTQTLIIDSFSNLEIAFDQQQALEPVMNQYGKVDKFAFWAHKKDYFVAVCNLLKSLKCNVVAIFHETLERNDEGDFTGKLKPVMTGSFKDQILGHFTDVFRQVTKAQKNTEGKVIGTSYLWQCKSDNICNCGSTIPNLGNGEMTILADYKSLNINLPTPT